MEEFSAWALGLLVGIGYPSPTWKGRRAIPFVALIAVLGVGVTLLSGEWSLNPGFVIVDIGQVALAAAIGLYAKRYVLARWGGAPIVSKRR